MFKSSRKFYLSVTTPQQRKTRTYHPKRLRHHLEWRSSKVPALTLGRLEHDSFIFQLNISFAAIDLGYVLGAELSSQVFAVGKHHEFDSGFGGQEHLDAGVDPRPVHDMWSVKMYMEKVVCQGAIRT